MAEQTCKDCNGRGFTVEYPLGFFGCGSPSTCWTCDGTGTINRTGPYRLADGTWSDGVDRSGPMHERELSLRRWEVWRDRWDGEWTAGYNPSEMEGSIAENFPTHAEAIRYADHHARTTKNGEARG